MNQKNKTISKTAKEAGYKSCLECNALVDYHVEICPLCSAKVATRIPHSLSKTTAYLITAIILFFPANFLPITNTISIFGEYEDTILSGVFYFWYTSDYFVAIVIFVASFITPLFKIVSIAYLIYTCHKRSNKHVGFRTKLYHINELMGRWSMIDVFVVALLGSLVQMGSLATIEPKIGIVAFALMVFFTLFSMNHLDPRLIWDHDEITPNEKTNVRHH